MFKQTVALCESLPKFATAIKASDRKGSAVWQVVRWENIDPYTVAPDQVRPLSTDELAGEAVSNRFGSRTMALRVSERVTREYAQFRSEKGHWGVWKWLRDGHTVYQAAVPVKSPEVPSGAEQHSNDQTAGGTVVRLTGPVYKMLRRLAECEHKTIQATLEAAIDEYDRQRFFQRANEAYAALKVDPQAWAEDLEDRRSWDATLMDSIEDDDYTRVAPPAQRVAKERRIA